MYNLQLQSICISIPPTHTHSDIGVCVFVATDVSTQTHFQFCIFDSRPFKQTKSKVPRSRPVVHGEISWSDVLLSFTSDLEIINTCCQFSHIKVNHVNRRRNLLLNKQPKTIKLAEIFLRNPEFLLSEWPGLSGAEVSILPEASTHLQHAAFMNDRNQPPQGSGS